MPGVCIDSNAIRPLYVRKLKRQTTPDNRDSQMQLPKKVVDCFLFWDVFLGLILGTFFMASITYTYVYDFTRICFTPYVLYVKHLRERKRMIS